MAASIGSGYLEIEVGRCPSVSRPAAAPEVDEEEELLWAAIERLPSQQRRSHAIMGGETVDVRRLDRQRRESLLLDALATNDQDNFNLLAAIKSRFERVGLAVPTVEVRFEGLTVSADVQSSTRALPTLINYVLDLVEGGLTSLRLLRPKKNHLTILNNISGVVKPGRMTLLLGPPGAGKSTLLLALAGQLEQNLKSSGSITYNGCSLDEFCVRRTSAYISQTDNHVGELTVRETLDFAATCQGASDSDAAYLKDLLRLEKEQNIRPRPEIDAYMKAASVGGKMHNLATDYVLKVLGLDVCAETNVGSDMIRGVSGGQRKRVTTGEMIVGPRKTLFMDEISTGLDSSTTYQVVKCMRNFVHQMEATLVMSLLQPAPETFDLFDDLILLSQGHIVYQGPREYVLEFFESLGFSLPPRKGLADFLQEVTSKKDQAQYWSDHSKPYVYLPVTRIAEMFKQSKYGRSAQSSLQNPHDPTNFLPSALARTKFAISKWNLLKACFFRELILLSRHRFLYIFRTCQVASIGFVVCTVYFRTRIHTVHESHGDLYLSSMFYVLVHMMVNGFSELSIMVARLPVFYKHRDSYFHPAWAFTIPSWFLRIPYSILESVVWSCVVYYVVGYAPNSGRFFRFMLVLFSMHQMSLGLFRLIAAVTRDFTIANTCGTLSLLVIILLGGFVVPKGAIKRWWIWGFWVSPMAYGQRAISVNEFTAHRWKRKSAYSNETVGEFVLHKNGLSSKHYWYWLGVGVLLAYSIVFNILFTLALAYMNPSAKAQAVVSSESTGENADSRVQATSSAANPRSHQSESVEINVDEESTSNEGMALPFTRLSMTFNKVNYFVDMPVEMTKKGIPEKKLQLLSGVSGVFRPKSLTALMGSSGAGKTTLMDVLAGRKTGGYIEGEIKISGFPKEQSTFARVSGYVEQNDIHSPQVTVEESLWFSSSLRLPKDVNKETRLAFVEEVMAVVELDELRKALVGLPGSTGLSTEQRKRLTIAVELVANPSIIFMDEPTSGLDARAAAIVMRTVRNTVRTGRTVVCTIHQPSISIFEEFDELILMKRGGQIIYGGPLGVNSQIMIDYFQGIDGVPRIPEGYNPATWMLEISTKAMEETIGQDFATIYSNSDQFRRVEELIQQESVPAPNTAPLQFSSKFSQDNLTQFKLCVWKQNLTYWRTPQYNFVRLLYTAVSALLIGSIFWDDGKQRATVGDLQLVMGSIYSASLFLGINNAQSIQPVVSIERTVYYRERAARMYASFPYAAAQGIIEIPYIAVQTIVYGFITYFMTNYEKAFGKLILYLLFMFLTFTYFTFYGMMAVGLTPTQHLAAVLSSSFYSLWNLFSGFLVPKRHIPGWWLWFYYMCPLAWTLRGIITSQMGDCDAIIVGPGYNDTVKHYLQKQLDYHTWMITVSIGVLILFGLLFFAIYAVSIKVLNFQKR